MGGYFKKSLTQSQRKSWQEIRLNIWRIRWKKSKLNHKKTIASIKESIADELMKLADLKEKGDLSNEEFLKLKQDLINRKPQF